MVSPQVARMTLGGDEAEPDSPRMQGTELGSWEMKAAGFTGGRGAHRSTASRLSGQLACAPWCQLWGLKAGARR